ncbi:MAG: TlyA family RNA methyltransferase [Lentisphaerae bacterium]|jgi:23S rRNA (cytidine1920-2'-O)/16S rRNA (cytidine1409-2'-O)-methyltransferase|nr:TlyA family RNA methyltransferase [Lentisphaerota bacterium]
MAKIRADQLMLELQLCESRSQAQRLIMAGEVRLGPDQLVQKPGQLLSPDTSLFLDHEPKYVSRGAFKLLAAFEHFQPELHGTIALDLGASTGGFTEVLLEYGAAKVYAVDVGYGQLHDKLRRNPKVVSLERTNARDLNSDLIPEPIDILTGDVSFISLTKVLPPCAPLLRPQAWVFVLVKPQFEAGREEVGSGGVVRDEAVRLRCVQKIQDFAVQELHWTCAGVVPSPIKGPKGNQEYIAVFRNA